MSIDSYKHFSNTKCKYYPCHPIKDMNCLFCFCPLYPYADCGGNLTMLNGVKDCSNCTLPHESGGWEKIIDRLTKEAEKKIDPNP